MSPAANLVWLNGQPATAEALAPLAFSGFAHFTALQIRGRGVKGFDLHLTRLRNASLRLFGHAIPDHEVTEIVRAAIEEGPEDVSLTATIFANSGEFRAESMNIMPSILLRAAPPANGPSGPLRLTVVSYERPMAEIKHVGEIAKTRYLHEALKQGYDDAVFVDGRGRLSEGTIWNAVFQDKEGAIVWPKADILTGTMMGIVQGALTKQGILQRDAEITLEDLAEMTGAAVMNSWTPGVAVSAIGEQTFPHSGRLQKLLHDVFATVPWSPL